MNTSSEHPEKEGCEKCGRCVYVVAVLGVFLIVAGLVLVMLHYTHPAPLGEDRAALRRKALMELRASNEEVLNNPNYVWQDPAKGVVRMPIDRAVELTLKLWQNPAAARSNLAARVEKANGRGAATGLRIGAVQMSATSPSPQAVVAGEGPAVSPVPASEIDESCRVPVLLLFLSAVGWLLASSALGLIASLKFHAPGLLADCPWFTYGRVHPAHLNALIYGFGVQAGLGAALWIIAHLSRAKLVVVPGVIAGAVLWNVGMAAGIVGILYGEATGYEWLEMPRYAAVMLFAGFSLVGVGGIMTMHVRRERPLYISQWYLLAALLWFPWIYSTANMLLVGHPVRGALQAGIDWWYMNNLATVWFGFTGLAVIFYFVPKMAKRPLGSHYLGIFIFWMLALFGSWGGIPAGSPLPAWMAAMSTMGTMLTLIPTVAVALIMRWTGQGGDCSELKKNRAFKFFMFGTLAYVIAGLEHALTSTMRVGKIINFTWFMPAHVQLVVYGFFAMTMFGAIYSIVPRLVKSEFCKPGMICAHFGFSVLGILLYAAPLMIGGILQGLALNDAKIPFLQVMTSTLMYLRISTTGDLLMAIGHLILALNLFGLLVRVGRTAATSAWTANTATVEVAS